MSRAPPVLRIAVGFAVGAAASTVVGLGPAALPVLATALPIALLRSLKSPALSLTLSFAAGVGWAEADARTRQRCAPAVADGARAVVEGYFLRSSAEGASTLRVVSGVGSRCREPTRVYSRTGAPLEGELVAVEGRWLTTRRGNGATAVYLSASSVRRVQGGEVPWRHRVAAAVRKRASEALEGRLGAQAGVAAALVLAEREGIPQDLWSAFARSGSAHLLSISGFHVGVVATLLGSVLSAAGRPPRSRALGTAAGVWAYVLLIGAPTSATRAAWMTTAFVVGRLRRTPAQALGGLGLSMLMIALLRPAAASGAGFQLTVTGTAGILVLSKWIMSVWPAHRGRGWIAPPIAAGIGASVFTAPVLAYHFGQVPLLSLPSSILLTPLVAAAVPGVILTILMDVLNVPGAAVAGAGSEGLLYAVVTVASALGELPGTTWTATPQEAALLTIGGLLPLALRRAPWRERPWVRSAAVALSAWAVLWLGQAALSLGGRGRVEIVAIDVGQGDAIAVRTPAGRWALVDAGPRFGGADAGLSRVVPYLRARGARRLEVVVLSHPDEDHAGGLASVLANVPVGAVLGPGFGGGQAGHMAGLKEARRAGVPWRRVAAGDVWRIDGVAFHVLSPAPEEAESAAGEPAPPDGERSPNRRPGAQRKRPPNQRPLPQRERTPNDWSVVLRVSWGDFDALLMGDADDRIEAVLLNDPALLGAGAVEVLKVGHHGSATSTSDEFVAAISPRHALVSAGARNRYGHPDPTVLARLERSGARILRTDRHGTVSVVGRADGSSRVGAGRRP